MRAHLNEQSRSRSGRGNLLETAPERAPVKTDMNGLSQRVDVACRLQLRQDLLHRHHGPSAPGDSAHLPGPEGVSKVPLAVDGRLPHYERAIRTAGGGEAGQEPSPAGTAEGDG